MVKEKDRLMSAMTLSIADTIRATSLSANTIYRLINKGELATVKVGARRLVKVSSLRRIIGDDAVDSATSSDMSAAILRHMQGRPTL